MLVVSGINKEDIITKMKKEVESRCADRVIGTGQHTDITKKSKKEKHGFTSILKEKHGL